MWEQQIHSGVTDRGLTQNPEHRTWQQPREQLENETKGHNPHMRWIKLKQVGMTYKLWKCLFLNFLQVLCVGILVEAGPMACRSWQKFIIQSPVVQWHAAHFPSMLFFCMRWERAAASECEDDQRCRKNTWLSCDEYSKDDIPSSTSIRARLVATMLNQTAEPQTTWSW